MGSCEQAILDLRQIFLHKELSHQELKRTQKCDMNPLLYVKLAFQSFFFAFYPGWHSDFAEPPKQICLVFKSSRLLLWSEDQTQDLRLPWQALICQASSLVLLRILNNDSKNQMPSGPQRGQGSFTIWPDNSLLENFYSKFCLWTQVRACCAPIPKALVENISNESVWQLPWLEHSKTRSPDEAFHPYTVYIGHSVTTERN